MLKEYNIHFNDRKIVLTNNLKKNFLSHFGYFAGYEAPNEFTKLLQFFQKLQSVKFLCIVGNDVDEMYKSFSEYFKVIEAAGGLVHNDKNEYLLIKRHGIWDLPKGKEEKGEKLKETALREVSEECGITKIELENHITETYHTYVIGEQAILKRTSWFSMRYTGNGEFIPQIVEDITEVKWVKREDLPAHLKETYPSIREVFQTAGIY